MLFQFKPPSHMENGREREGKPRKIKMPGKVLMTHKLTRNSALPRGHHAYWFPERDGRCLTHEWAHPALSGPSHKVSSATPDDDHHQRGSPFVTLLPAVKLQ